MRSVPPALQSHLDGHSTTTCMLLKVTLRNGDIFGLTSLDRDVVFDDGETGVVTYVATNGFDPSMIATDIGFTVENAEASALISDDIPGITEQMVEAGQLDDARWAAYLVNYLDLGQEHLVLDAGDLGEVRTQHGLVWISELLSYAMRLRQPVGHVWSRLCRAKFGSPAASHDGCGVDVSGLWDTGEVTEIGLESDRNMTGDLTTSSNWPVTPVPGVLEWLTGDNVGREYSIEAFASGEVTLNEPVPYPIQIGDEYQIRPDCRKRYTEDCIDTWANGENFKGEPHIPVGDATALQVPGGQLPGAGGFYGVDE